MSRHHSHHVIHQCQQIQVGTQRRNHLFQTGLHWCHLPSRAHSRQVIQPCLACPVANHLRNPLRATGRLHNHLRIPARQASLLSLAVTLVQDQLPSHLCPPLQQDGPHCSHLPSRLWCRQATPRSCQRPSLHCSPLHLRSPPWRHQSIQVASPVSSPLPNFASFSFTYIPSSSPHGGTIP